MKNKNAHTTSNTEYTHNIGQTSDNCQINWNPDIPTASPFSGITHTNYCYTTFDAPPTAHIAINNNRIKQYEGKYYLNDGDEFQIELTNNSVHKYLIKIKLNGKYISSSGLVLDSHSHHFLDRYIDTDKKFKFKTFMVDDVDETTDQRKRNGLIELEYYRQTIFYQPFTMTYENTSPYTLTSNVNVYHNDAAQLINKSQIETGRVNEGSKSNQQFVETSGDFDTFVQKRESFQILPQSQKPPKQIKQIRQYCSECGLRIRKSSWKYCPQCGEKI